LSVVTHGERGELRTLFATAAYRRLLATRISAQLGDGAFQVGLAHRETTPAAVAWALSASLLPYTLVGPFAGVLLDRWYRRQVLLVANLVRAVLVVTAALLVWSSSINVTLLVTVLATLSVDRFFLAGLGAGLPHVVDRRLLVVANSVTPTLGTIAHAVGGGLAFWLSQARGGTDSAGTLAILAAMLAYLVSALMVLRIPVDQLGPDGGPRHGPVIDQVVDLAVGMVHGARHLWHRPPARWSMVLTGACRIGFGSFAIVSILLCRNTFSGGDVSRGLALVGTVAALGGVGAGLAAVLMPPLVRRFGLHTTMVSCLLVAAAVYAAWAVGTTRTTLLALAAPLAVCVQAVKIGVDTTLQTAVDETYLGRAFSLYDMTFNAAFVVAAMLSVLTVPASGRAPLLFGGVAVLMVIVGSMTALSRHYRSSAASQ
jgi:MFS family permease